MNILTMPLGPIFEARISLGGDWAYCGLIEKEMGMRELFIYELLPPLDAKAFFLILYYRHSYLVKSENRLIGIYDARFPWMNARRV